MSAIAPSQPVSQHISDAMLAQALRMSPALVQPIRTWLAVYEPSTCSSRCVGLAAMHLDALERLPMLEASLWPCVLVLSPGSELVEASPDQGLDV